MDLRAAKISAALHIDKNSRTARINWSGASFRIPWPQLVNRSNRVTGFTAKAVGLFSTATVVLLSSRVFPRG
jgi:hypothetical protein